MKELKDVEMADTEGETENSQDEAKVPEQIIREIKKSNEDEVPKKQISLEEIYGEISHLKEIMNARLERMENTVSNFQNLCVVDLNILKQDVKELKDIQNVCVANLNVLKQDVQELKVIENEETEENPQNEDAGADEVKDIDLLKDDEKPFGLIEFVHGKISEDWGSRFPRFCRTKRKSNIGVISFWDEIPSQSLCKRMNLEHTAVTLCPKNEIQIPSLDYLIVGIYCFTARIDIQVDQNEILCAFKTKNPQGTIIAVVIKIIQSSTCNMTPIKTKNEYINESVMYYTCPKGKSLPPECQNANCQTKKKIMSLTA